MAVKSTRWLIGDRSVANKRDFSEEIAFDDHKIRFAVSYCQGKDVLDLGCVQHNPENYKSRYWLHKALAEVSKTLEGLDLYEDGVEYLQRLGYHVYFGDAEKFDLGKRYDVIVAGDIIEHLENLRGFLKSCRSHLRRGGGVILISTPNPWYWRNVLKALFFGRVSNNPEHTLWMCPVTLGQLLARHNLKLEHWHYGSRYMKDKLMPLPKGLKHTSFHAVVGFADEREDGMAYSRAMG